VPGLGAIHEVQDLNRAMAALWQNEAAAFKGQRVVISVVNSPRPISGTLVLLSHDGLLIQTDRMDHVPVGYSRISGIDPESLLLSCCRRDNLGRRRVAWGSASE